MKTLKLLLLIPLLLIGLAGCEKDEEQKNEYEIYENHDISACGVNDPLVNIGWLAELAHGYSNLYSGKGRYILVYRNNFSKDDTFMVKLYPQHGDENIKSNVPAYPYIIITVYSCEGQVLIAGEGDESNEQYGPLHSETQPIPYESWNDFFLQNELIDTIWAIKKQY
jgi:hypothetical protein